MFVIDGEPVAKVGYKALAQTFIVVDNDGVVDPHEKPQNSARRRGVSVEAHVNRRLREVPRNDEFGEQLPPNPASLLEAVEAAVEFDDEATTIWRAGGKAWWHGHVEVLTQLSLEEGLLHINGRQVIVASGGDGKDDADRCDLDHRRKDAIEVDPLALSIAVGDETALELFDGTVREPFDSEHHVAAHNVDILGELIEKDVVPRTA